MSFRNLTNHFHGLEKLYSSYLRKTGLSEPIINGLAGGMAANTFWLCAYPFGESEKCEIRMTEHDKCVLIHSLINRRREESDHDTTRYQAASTPQLD